MSTSNYLVGFPIRRGGLLSGSGTSDTKYAQKTINMDGEPSVSYDHRLSATTVRYNDVGPQLFQEVFLHNGVQLNQYGTLVDLFEQEDTAIVAANWVAGLFIIGGTGGVTFYVNHGDAGEANRLFGPFTAPEGKAQSMIFPIYLYELTDGLFLEVTSGTFADGSYAIAEDWA